MYMYSLRIKVYFTLKDKKMCKQSTDCVDENFKDYFAVLFLQPNHITCIPNMFIYYLYQGLGIFFHIAHYEKFSLWVKFRFIQMYYFIFLY